MATNTLSDLLCKAENLKVFLLNLIRIKKLNKYCLRLLVIFTSNLSFYRSDT